MTRRRGQRRSQGGFSLIEVLFALAISGIVLVTAAFGFLVSTESSRRVGEEARARAVLDAAGTVLQGLPYDPKCNDTEAQEYTTALRTALTTGGFLSGTTMAGISSSSQFAVTRMRWWNANTNLFESATNRCLSSGSVLQVDQGTQELTLQVTLDGKNYTSVIVKRRS